MQERRGLVEGEREFGKNGLMSEGELRGASSIENGVWQQQGKRGRAKKK